LFIAYFHVLGLFIAKKHIFDFDLRIFKCCRHILSYMTVTGYSYMSTQFLCEKVGNSEKLSKALKIQIGQFEKRRMVDRIPKNARTLKLW
jgi:hypothetical protein